MLTVDQARDRASDIVARAIRAGADAADALYAGDASTEVSVRLGALEDIGRSESEALGLRVFVGQRSASVAMSDWSADAVTALVERAVAMARKAPEDEWAGLAPADRLMHGPPPALDLDDGGEVAPDALKQRALTAEDAGRAVAGVTNSEGATASSGRSVMALATSHGFAAGYATSSHSVTTVVVAGGSDAMERDYDYHSARHLRHLEDPAAIGRRAGERAVARVNPGRLASG
ncbi:MAG: TldD/PmbA family protein, partial [Sphingomonas sp.]